MTNTDNKNKTNHITKGHIMDTNTIIKSVVDSSGVFNSYGVVNRYDAVSCKPKISKIDNIFNFADKMFLLSCAICIGAIVYAIVTL